MAAADDWLLSSPEYNATKPLPESENVLDLRITAEAERVFRQSAIAELTELVPEYSLAETYK